MLHSVPKIYKGRRLIIIFVQLKEPTSQTAEKMYKVEGEKFIWLIFDKTVEKICIKPS